MKIRFALQGKDRGKDRALQGLKIRKQHNSYLIFLQLSVCLAKHSKAPNCIIIYNPYYFSLFPCPVLTLKLKQFDQPCKILQRHLCPFNFVQYLK